MSDILLESHVSGTEKKYQYKIADNTEAGLLKAVQENASAIFFALEQELGNSFSFESSMKGILPKYIEKKDREKAENSLAKIEASFKKALDLARIAHLALELGANGSSEQARLQSLLDKIEAGAEDWKMKIQDFKAQIVQL